MSDQQPGPTIRRSRRPRAVRLAVAASTCVVLATAATALALTWGTPADLSAAGQDAYEPQISIAPNGAATAVWRRSNGSNTVVQAATRPAGSSAWGTPSDLSAAGQDADGPEIATAPDGATTAVWRRSNGSNTVVQAATRPAGSNAWGVPAGLSATGQNASFPQISIAPDGATTAVWYRSNGSNFIVQAATRPAGSNTWGTPADLSAAGQNALAPQVAIAPDGAATAVWYRFNGSNFIVQAATRPAGSNTWGTPADLSATGRTAESPRISIAPDGAATVVWFRSNGSNTIVQAATRPAGSNTWGTPTDLSAAGQSADTPQISIAPDGAATVVWSRWNGSKWIVQAATRPAGSNAWGTPGDLSATGQNAYRPQVSIAPDGAATAVWYRFNGSTYIVQAATRPAGSTAWGTPGDLSATGQDAGSPQISTAPDGAATAIWHRSNGSNTIVQAATSAPATYPLTIATEGTGAGTVTSSPAGITCGATCTGTFALSSTITLTATPSADSSFAGWSGDCAGTSATCRITVLGARAATAAFTANPGGTTPSSNAFSILRMRATRSTVTTRIRLPGPGKLTQRGTFRAPGASSTARKTTTRTACSVSRTVRTGTTLTVTCPLNAAARRARTKGPLRLRVATTFTPTGGTARTTTRTVTFLSRRR